MVSTYSLRTSQPRADMRTSGSRIRTLYKSQRFGYAVTGTHRWIVADMDTSEADPDTDSVMLHMHGSSRADVNIVGVNRCNVLDPAETVRFWTSREYLEDFMEPGTLVVLSDRTRTSGGVVMVSPGADTGNPMVTVKEVFDLANNVSVRVSLTTELATFHETYRSIQQALHVDQKGVLNFFSKDVLRAVLPS